MADLLPWLTLKNTPGIGNLLFHRLLERFGTPQAVLAAPADQLLQVEGISPAVARSISGRKPSPAERRELDEIRSLGFRLLCLQDPDYPRLLAHIADPPPLLYVHGRLPADRPAVAIVGSRKATDYGRRTARRLAAGLARHGWTVVSGLALGIDTAAHLGALDAGGKTVAVTGCGLKTVYPPANRKLAQRIAASGAVVTEFSLDSRPEAHHFPLRNRIISGMSLGVVVVEAARRSGSLITARLALEQGREVFAVPGSVNAPTSKGTHELIRQGARLVENADQIVEELAAQAQWVPEPAGNPPTEPAHQSDGHMTAIQQRVLAHLSPYPMDRDTLAGRCGLDAGTLAAVLLELELMGRVLQGPPDHFRLA